MSSVEDDDVYDSAELDAIGSSTHAEKVLAILRELRAVPGSCDLVLTSRSDGIKVSVDRKVIAACSEYFRVMFYGTLPSRESEVLLDDITGPNLERLVEYCYTGSLKLNADIVQDLLPTASFLLMESAVSACSAYLIKNLDPSNCLAVCLLAERLNCMELLRQSEEYAGQHYVEVMRQPEFIDLDAEHLMRFLRSERLRVPTEQEVADGVLAWLDHDRATRRRYLLDLLPLLCLSLLSPAFISRHLMPLVTPDEWPLIREKAAITGATFRHWTKTDVLLVGGHYRIDHMRRRIGRTIKLYDEQHDNWLDWDEMPDERYWFGLALLGDNLMVIGGFDDRKQFSSVHNLNLSRMEWTTMPALQVPRASVCVAVLGDAVYAIGGAHSRREHKSVERWTAAVGRWEYVQPMLTARSFAGAAVINERLYVMGGGLENNVLRSMECYDSATNQWTSLAPMNRARRDFAIAVSNGQLYVAGGLPITSTVERYDPATDKWTMLCSMSNGRCGFTSAFVGNRLLAIGGYSHVSMDNVEQYDVDGDRWTDANPLDTHISSPVAVHVPRVYVEAIKWTKQ